MSMILGFLGWRAFWGNWWRNNNFSAFLSNEVLRHLSVQVLPLLFESLNHLVHFVSVPPFSRSLELKKIFLEERHLQCHHDGQRSCRHLSSLSALESCIQVWFCTLICPSRSHRGFYSSSWFSNCPWVVPSCHSCTPHEFLSGLAAVLLESVSGLAAWLMSWYPFLVSLWYLTSSLLNGSTCQ